MAMALVSFKLDGQTFNYISDCRLCYHIQFCHCRAWNWLVFKPKLVAEAATTIQGKYSIARDNGFALHACDSTQGGREKRLIALLLLPHLENSLRGDASRPGLSVLYRNISRKQYIASFGNIRKYRDTRRYRDIFTISFNAWFWPILAFIDL